MNGAGLTGLASLLSTIHGLYPQARVTSGYRGPGNPLTQRNPASMHAQGSADDPRAVDVAPIPGVSFNDYVSSVRKAGVPVAQAFDEASHPFPWTTGPNWHIASGASQVAPRKPRSLADIMPSNPYMQMPVGLPGDIHGINGGTWNVDGSQATPMSLAGLMRPQQPSPMQQFGQDVQANIPAIAPKKPSPFTAGNVLGVLGDALMAYGGMQPQFGPELARQQELDKRDTFDREKFDRQLQAERDIALFKSQLPPNNDTANDYAFWQQHLSPEEFQQWVANKVNPPQYMNVPGVGLVQIPRNAPGAPTRPVGKLTPIPGE